MNKKESLNELSKKTLGSYIKKAAYDVDRKAVKRTLANDKDHGKLIGKSMKRLRSISRATERLTKEDVESLDELSRKTLNSYVSKSASNYQIHRKLRDAKLTANMGKDDADTDNHDRVSKKRAAGIYKADNRLDGHYEPKGSLVRRKYRAEDKENIMTTKPLVEDETEQVATTPPNPFEVSRELYDQLIQEALAGNAVDVRNAVNDIMVTKAAEVVDVVKDEVAQTMFGTDDRPKGDEDDEDEWEPEDDNKDLDDEDDDTEHPEFDDEDDVEGYDDDEEVESFREDRENDLKKRINKANKNLRQLGRAGAWTDKTTYRRFDRDPPAIYSADSYKSHLDSHKAGWQKIRNKSKAELKNRKKQGSLHFESINSLTEISKKMLTRVKLMGK